MTATRPRLLRLEDRVTPSTSPAGVADRVLVTFSEVVPEGVRVATLTAADAGAFVPLGFGVYAVDLRAGDGAVAESARLGSLNGVLSAVPDLFVPPEALAAASGDPAFASQRRLQAAQRPAAWTVAPGTGRTIVAVIDSGVDVTHPDLAPNLWTNPREIPGNGVDDDGDGFVDDVHGVNLLTNTGDVSDTLGHGTAVLGRRRRGRGQRRRRPRRQPARHAAPAQVPRPRRRPQQRRHPAPSTSPSPPGRGSST